MRDDGDQQSGNQRGGRQGDRLRRPAWRPAATAGLCLRRGDGKEWWRLHRFQVRGRTDGHGGDIRNAEDRAQQRPASLDGVHEKMSPGTKWQRNAREAFYVEDDRQESAVFHLTLVEELSNE